MRKPVSGIDMCFCSRAEWSFHSKSSKRGKSVYRNISLERPTESETGIQKLTLLRPAYGKCLEPAVRHCEWRRLCTSDTSLPLVALIFQLLNKSLMLSDESRRLHWNKWKYQNFIIVIIIITIIVVIIIIIILQITETWYLGINVFILLMMKLKDPNAWYDADKEQENSWREPAKSIVLIIDFTVRNLSTAGAFNSVKEMACFLFIWFFFFYSVTGG